MSLVSVTRKESSFALAGNQKFAIDTWTKQEKYFQKSHGTGFEHYWFQKLEYVLWLQFKSEIALLHGEDKRKFDEFRITSKNSVEHVHPQNEENSKRLVVKGSRPQDSEGELQDRYDPLNAFGNLVLLSPSENSSYSNQTVLKKKADFIGKPQISSLKLQKIFAAMGENAEWDVEKIRAHQQEMISVLDCHYKKSGL